ncbi:MAG: glycoside hydrolase family 127 protein [Clostridiales bacterium]|nr:glycoside hydrolase family 127 protein [Clostridiales bacterium]
MVRVIFKGSEAIAMKLAVRIPGWCDNWNVFGAESYHCTQVKGYCYVDGIWNNGDEIIFYFIFL